MRIPRSAPFPVATITAVGTASPMAQGQAITSTDTAAVTARTKGAESAARYQTTKVSAARPRTTGTKTPLIRSARRCIGARVPWASRIMVTMRASTVASPTARVIITKAPVRFTVPPTTRSPGPRSTGIGSPVTIDSSTADRPEATTPSTGIRSPGRTWT